MKLDKMRFVALFMTALIITLSVPHFSFWNLSFGSDAAEAQTTDDPSMVAAVYETTNFNNRLTFFTSVDVISDLSIDSSLNNNIGSVKVKSGWKIILYAGISFSGPSITITQNTDLRTLTKDDSGNSLGAHCLTGSWADCASSLKVEQATGSSSSTDVACADNGGSCMLVSDAGSNECVFERGLCSGASNRICCYDTNVQKTCQSCINPQQNVYWCNIAGGGYCQREGSSQSFSGCITDYTKIDNINNCPGASSTPSTPSGTPTPGGLQADMTTTPETIAPNQIYAIKFTLKSPLPSSGQYSLIYSTDSLNPQQIPISGSYCSSTFQGTIECRTTNLPGRPAGTVISVSASLLKTGDAVAQLITLNPSSITIQTPAAQSNDLDGKPCTGSGHVVCGQSGGSFYLYYCQGSWIRLDQQPSTTLTQCQISCEQQGGLLCDSRRTTTTTPSTPSTPGGTSAPTTVTGLSCSSCQGRQGGTSTYCVITNQNFNPNYPNANIYSTQCIDSRTSKTNSETACKNKGGEPWSDQGAGPGTNCPTLCEQVCIAYAYTGLSVGRVGGVNTQGLTIPVGTCSETKPLDFSSITITSNSGQRTVRDPHYLAAPGVYCSNQKDVCWCTIFDTQTLYGTTGTTSNTGGMTTVPGTTRTPHWTPPAFNAPRAQPNQPVCEISSVVGKNATLIANLVGADGAILKQTRSGQPVTVKGSISTLTSTCQGYSYSCLNAQEYQCDYSSGFLKDTWKYQACPANTNVLAEKGAGKDWKIGKLVGLIATAILVAVTFQPELFSFLNVGTAGTPGFIEGAKVAEIAARSAQMMGRTLDGCDPNYAALGPLLNSIDDITKNNPSTVQQGGACTYHDECDINNGFFCDPTTKRCVSSAGTGSSSGTGQSKEDVCSAICGGRADYNACYSACLNTPSTGQLVANIPEPDSIFSNSKRSSPTQSITGMQIPNCQGDTCKSLFQTFVAGMGSLQNCPAKKARECWRVCGSTYNTEVGASPTCSAGGVPQSARAGHYTCAPRSCGGTPEAPVNIRIIGPGGMLIAQDSTRTDSTGGYSYTFNAPEVDGEVTIIVSTPLPGVNSVMIGTGNIPEDDETVGGKTTGSNAVVNSIVPVTQLPPVNALPELPPPAES